MPWHPRGLGNGECLLIYKKIIQKKCMICLDGATHAGKPGVHSHVPLSGQKGISKAPVSTREDLLLKTNDALPVPLRFPGEPVRIPPQNTEGRMAMSSLPNPFCNKGYTTLSQDCQRIFTTRSGQHQEDQSST